MTIKELIVELQKYPETDQVEIFIGDLENKGLSTLTVASKVMRCPVRFGSMRMGDNYKTIWITG